MRAEVFGWQHWVYLAITIGLTVAGLICAKKFAKTEKSQNIILKCMAAFLLVWILANRLSQVFRYEEHRWDKLIPDSFCGMSSLVLSLSVLIGKKDNCVYHFVWLIALVGGVITIAYPTFIGQDISFFYLPTISGLLHHSASIALVIALLLFKQIHITYKKWYCMVFGFCGYFTVGAFLMTVFGYTEAFHMVEPLLDNTPLTAWFVAPIYVGCYALLLLIIELVRKHKLKKNQNKLEETKTDR